MSKYCEPSKESFTRLLKDANFKSRREFCRVSGISNGSLENNLSGRFAPNVETLVRIAGVLRAPLIDVVKCFYPRLVDEYGVK